MEEQLTPGIHHHYKGGIYRALMLVRSSERRSQLMVVYDSLTQNPEERSFADVPWCRPFKRISGVTPVEEDCWLDVITWPDGISRNRFVHEKLISPQTVEENRFERLRQAAKKEDHLFKERR